MILLAIETSCDETAIAIVKRTRGKKIGCEVLAHKVLSQASLHSPYGGVFPTLAKREHAKALPQLIAEGLHEAGLLVERSNEKKLSSTTISYLQKLLVREPTLFNALIVLFEGIQKPKIDAIAVTCGPGLPPALWVGVNCAQALGKVWGIPLYPINHMEGHVLVSLLSSTKKNMYELEEAPRPALALLLSGGHTQIVRITKARNYTIIGDTKDDAVGEAFDKVARLLGLPYPGGPAISSLAEKARMFGTEIIEDFELPRPMINSPDLHFSMSGLKTAVLTRVQKHEPLSEEHRHMLALSFENAVADVVRQKIKKAIYEMKAEALIFGGGVSANSHLRSTLESVSIEEDIALYLPDKKLSGDNALMVAITGLYHIAHGVVPKKSIAAFPGWKISEPYKIPKTPTTKK